MKIFILLLCAIYTLAVQAQSLLIDQWQTTGFLGSSPSALDVKTATGAMTMTVTADAPAGAAEGGKRIYSLSQPLQECDMNGVLLLKFEARQTASRQLYLICVAGSSPGNCPPCTHSVIYPTDIWKEFKVQLPLSGLNENSFFEFIWEGVLKKGDKIELRNLRLVEDESKSSAQFSIQSPINLVLDPAAANQKFSGIIRSLRSQRGGTWVMEAADEFEPETVIAKVSGKIESDNTPWSIDASKLLEGKYILTLNITTTNGAAAKLIVRNVWKSDLSASVFTVRNNTIHKKGKPFIPIGIYHAGMWNIDRANEISRQVNSKVVTYDEAYADIAAHGFNAIHTCTKPDSTDLNQVAKAVEAHGLMLIPEVKGTGKFTVPGNLMGWYGMDEASSGIAQQRGRQIYADVKALEPNYPVYAANYIKTIISDMQENGCMFDVLLFDHYVIRTSKTDFTELDQEMQQLKKDIVKVPEIVLGYVPQAFIFCGPEPTQAQLRIQIYIAIINNVRAFIYYSYNEDYDHRTNFTSRKDEFPELPNGMSKNPKRRNWWIVDSVLWEEAGKLNKEIQALSDFILNDGAPVKALCSTSGIDFATKKVNGKTYFIAINLKPEPLTANFRFAGAVKFKEMFGDKTFTTKRGANMLNFASYEVKVFVTE